MRATTSQTIAAQEAALVFPAFDEATAFAIGSAIRERGLSDKAADRHRHPAPGIGRCSTRRCPARPPPMPTGRGASAMSCRDVPQEHLPHGAGAAAARTAPSRRAAASTAPTTCSPAAVSRSPSRAPASIGVIAVSGLPRAARTMASSSRRCASISARAALALPLEVSSLVGEPSAGPFPADEGVVDGRGNRSQVNDLDPKPSSPPSSTRRSPPPIPSSPSASTCPNGRRAAPSSSAPARARRRWRRRSRRPGTGRSRASSSPATAMPRPAERIEVIEAAHPVPDAAGLAAVAAAAARRCPA